MLESLYQSVALTMTLYHAHTNSTLTTHLLSTPPPHLAAGAGPGRPMSPPDPTTCATHTLGPPSAHTGVGAHSGRARVAAPADAREKKTRLDLIFNAFWEYFWPPFNKGY